VGDIDPNFAGGDGFLPVSCQASATPELCEGAFDDPPSGENFEVFGGIGALDDFERPLSDPVQCAAQFRSGIGGIGEQVAQSWAGMAYGLQHRRRAVAVLNIGCMHDQSEEHAGGVDDGVALGTLDFLSGVITANPACLRGLLPSGCR